MKTPDTIAERLIEQWENHGKHRIAKADLVLFANGIEPDEVQLARAYLKCKSELELTESMLNFDAEPAVVHTTAQCKTCKQFYGYHFPCRCGNHL